MNKSSFNALVDEFMGAQKKILHEKMLDYACDDDQLANFKALAHDLGLPPLQVWFVYFKKHVDALAKLAREGKLNSEPPLGRFLDVANYAILGFALHSEREEPKTPPPTAMIQARSNGIPGSWKPDNHDI